MATNGIDALSALQALAAAREERRDGASKKDRTGSDSFGEIFAKMEKEQREWDDLMNKVDIAQYKLALSDAFWSDQAEPQRFLSSYIKRQQTSMSRAALGTLTKNAALLNHLNTIGVASGTISAEAAQEATKKLSSAMTAAMMASIKSSGMSWNA